jgi:hypothetical protein
MRKIWDFKIHKDIKKEFPNDPMMQELHELRMRKPFSSLKEEVLESPSFKKHLKEVNLKLFKTKKGYKIESSH